QTGQGRNQRFSVRVDSADYQNANEVLHEFGLPREDHETVEELTEQKGFIPNSQEMAQMRLERALAVQLEHLLQALPGVVDVRATVQSQRGERAQPTASVVIRYVASGGKTPFSLDEIRRLAM